MNNDSKKMACLAIDALEDKKAIDVKVIDTRGFLLLLIILLLPAEAIKTRSRLCRTMYLKCLGKPAMNQSRWKVTMAPIGF